MASSSTVQPIAWADVTFKYEDNVLVDTASYDRNKKSLLTHIGKSTQTGAALGARAIASMTAPVLDDPTPADDINENFAEQQRFKTDLATVTRERLEWTSVNTNIYFSTWAQSATSMREKLLGLQSTYAADGTITFRGYDVISAEHACMMV